MEGTRLLYLYGGTGSGKTVLLRLLDGHPEVAVTPIHDKFPEAFARSNLDGFPVERTTSQIAGDRHLDLHRFQTALTESRYNRLQGAHHGRPVRFAASSRDLQGRPMAGFDFYAFEETWIDRVYQRADMDPHAILYEIFDSLFAHWDRYPYDSDTCKYFVGLGAPNPRSITYTLEHWPEARVVFLRRDPRGCIASKAQKVEEATAYDLLRRGRMYNVRAMNDIARTLQDRYQNRVKIVEFDELILNSETVMDDIRTFLRIEHDSILERATFCGEDLDSYNQDYIGQINDQWSDLLTADEKRLASLQLGNPSPGDFRPRVLLHFTESLLRLRLQSTIRYAETLAKASDLYP